MRQPKPSGNDLWKKTDKIPVVCEILDPRTQQTIRANEKFASVSDFLQSNDMVGKILAMVAEDILVKHILDELLEANRSQLEIMQASSFLQANEPVSFLELARRIRQQTMLLVGYMDWDHENECLLPPTINPPHKEVSRTWTKAMCIVITQSSTAPSADQSESMQTDATASNSKAQALTNNMHEMLDHGAVTAQVNAVDVGVAECKERIGELALVIQRNDETAKHAASRLEDRLKDLAEELGRTLKYNVQIVETLSTAETAEKMVHLQMNDMRTQLETLHDRLYHLESHVITGEGELAEDENTAM